MDIVKEELFMRKKVFVFLLSAVMVLSFSASSNNTDKNNSVTSTSNEVTSSSEEKEKTPETITIKSLNAEKNEVDLEVPYDPERIAILDMASLDILDSLGLGDRIVGSAGTSLDYLQEYVTDENIANLGTIKEADMEAVMECEPDVIFIGGRLSASYDALSEIAPVVYLATDTEIGVVESVRKNATTIASMFGLEEDVEELMADFDDRIKTLSEFAEGKTAIVGLCTSGKIGRASCRERG